MKDARECLKLRIIKSIVMVLAVTVVVFSVFTARAFSQTGEGNQIAEPNESGQVSSDLQKIQVEEMKYALLAAAIAFGLGALGAGIAISHVGAAAMGAVAEKPQVAGQALIFVALAEGIVVFGFITALMIIGKV